MVDPSDRESTESEEEFEVRDLTIQDAYVLGRDMTVLKFCGEIDLHIGSIERSGVLYYLERIQNRLVATDTASVVASQVEDVKRAIYSRHGEDVAPATEMDESLSEYVSKNAETWAHLLSEKLVNENRINIPSAGVLDWEQLMDHPDSLFEEGIWNELDDGPRNDIGEACRSLPLGCSTASVMVSLRAVEHYLRKWYENKQDEELERGTWGSVLDDLIDIYIAEEDVGGPVIQQLSGVPSVLSNLHYLKEKRNKVSHPDESPSIYEAVITLFMVAGTISEVCHEIGDITESVQDPIE